jgi:hypothetical protein
VIVGTVEIFVVLKPQVFCNYEFEETVLVSSKLKQLNVWVVWSGTCVWEGGPPNAQKISRYLALIFFQRAIECLEEILMVL